MSDQLYQVNVAYVPREDRLLLRVSTRKGDEFRVWLTRRYAALLLALLRKRMEKFGGAPSLASSQEARQLFKAGAMEKSYEPEKAESYPLGESGVLGYKINSRMKEDGELVLQLLPEKGQGLNLNLNRTLIYMFYNVLTQGVEQANWHLDTGDASANVH